MSLHLNVIREPDSDCKECGLYKTCEAPIMNGSGPEDEPLWFGVGEAPGKTEDQAKDPEPFLGQAGELLRQIMEEVGFDMRKVRLSNAVRCRPPNNDLSAYPEAIDYCKPKILREIHVVNPKVVILFGAVALKSVLDKKGIVKLNGEVFHVNGRYYVPCVHPSFVLRDPAHQAKFKKALKIAYRLGKKTIAKSVAKKFYDTVRDSKMLQEYSDMLKNLKVPCASDIETSTLSYYSREVKPELGCAGFSWEPNYAICFPVHARVGYEHKISVKPEEVVEALREIYGSVVDFIFHNGKFDVGFLGHINRIKVRNYWYDTILASYALDENKGIHGLKDWAWRVGMGGHEQDRDEWLRQHPEDNPEKGGNFNRLPGRIMYPYNMGDCDVTIRVFNYTFPRLIEQNLYKKPFLFPLMYHNWTAMQLEKNGLALDLSYNDKLLREFPEKMQAIEKRLKQFDQYTRLKDLRLYQLIQSKVRRVATYKKPPKHPKAKVIELVNAELEKLKEKGKELVNLASPDDKRDLIYKFCGYKARYETHKSGLPSTKMEHLEEMYIARPKPVLELVINRSKYASSWSKYVNPLRRWAGTDNRTHTTYMVFGQVTGRVGSEDPNHENLPKRSNGELERELVKYLRTQFCATNEDYLLAEADEKQIEMRLFCDRAHDDIMLSEFLAFKDPHAMGAMAGFRLTQKEWDKLPPARQKELRNRSKNAISFGLLYGRSVKALAADMGWSLERAQEFVDQYFGKYDDCFKYRKEVERFVTKHKYVISHFGRVRRLPAIDSEDFGVKNEALRQAINSPIQGDASDLTWCAGHRLEHWLQKYHMKSKVVAGVHDALYTDIYRKEMDDVLEMKYKFLTDREWFYKKTGWKCEVPLDIDISLGPNLGNMTEMKRLTQGEFDFEFPESLAA